MVRHTCEWTTRASRPKVCHDLKVPVVPRGAGLICSVWRFSTRYSACPACNSANIVPIDSPMGKKLASEIFCSNGIHLNKN
jgi:hypothetical protein